MTGADALIPVYAAARSVREDLLFVDTYTITRYAAGTKDAKGVTVPGAAVVAETGRCRMWTGRTGNRTDDDGVTRAVVPNVIAVRVWMPVTSTVEQGDDIAINTVPYTVTRVEPVGLDAPALTVWMEPKP